jgi:tRNA threonylcarbamoyladenosine dehydratase
MKFIGLIFHIFGTPQHELVLFMVSTNNERSSHDNRSALIAGFLAGCGVTATVASLVLLRRQRQQNETNRCCSPPHAASCVLPLDIREEQLSRHTLYFGKDGVAKLKRARVCVVGVGGVGSHTAHMLARSGLGHLRLIDFDQVTVSSLNRHACAVLSDVGTSKVECCAKFLRKICPDPRHLVIETRNEMYTAESGERLLRLDGAREHPRTTESVSLLVNGHSKPAKSSDWDMVIDCIDDVPTKVALLAHCLEHKIRVVSCMGAGGKADPTRLHISDLRSAAKDPLATKIRQTLKSFMTQKHSSNAANNSDEDVSYLDDMQQLTVLYSSEKTVVKLADFTDEQKELGVHKFGAVDGMRIRVIPVLGTMPAIMGQALASICLTGIAAPDQPMQPVTSERVGRNTRNKLFQTLRSREQVLAARVRAEAAAMENNTKVTSSTGCASVRIEPTTSVHGSGELVTISQSNGSSTSTWIGELQIDQNEDVEYLLEIWRNRCAVTGARLGTVLHLTRWNLSHPSTCDNLVLVSANVLPQIEADPEGYKCRMDLTIRTSIEQRLASCRVDR